ncbi:7-deoxyloganetic acid glucosyltransferase-like [Silene latifolia]|uniref:7-deoxyloganetic acid glucosyltransferase-like n=1 Tax=Silene latifolia TaxID=37657 RepID=UPI003D774311
MGGEQVVDNKVAHILLLPLPLQGPVNCFLKLAHLLSTADDDFHITVVNAAFIRLRLPDLPSRFPKVSFVEISDGIAGDHPRPPSEFSDMVRNFETGFISRLLELMPATCLIADGVFPLAGKKAMEMGIPVVYFSTLSPSCVWASCRLVPMLVDARLVPFKNGDLDEAVTNIPGSEAAIRRRDLPGICRAQDMDEPYVQLILRECRELPIAQGHILNTYDKLEGTALLSELRSLFPNLYTIGPIHSLAKTRIPRDMTDPKMGQCSSFWHEDRSCLKWLDEQPSKSVLFVSFGSIISLTFDQLTEFWHGLINSGTRFLWVQRPDSSVRADDNVFLSKLPPEILKGRKERGRVVTWAPQEEVLAHRAVGGFLTHSGWNSTLESVVEGVPMICWPKGIDQLVISRFVEEDWKIGIDMKDKCDRVVIEGMVRDLMERKDEFFEKADVLAKLASEAVNEGGSSWCALNRLIEDIKFMRFDIPQ